jgi:hypothetical protein
VLVWLAAATGGIALLVRPFVGTAPPWTWELRGPDDLAGAAVNADLVSIDDRGALLSRQGQRGISIITPPLAWAANSNRVLVVQACRPEVSPEEPVATAVRLLWQTEPAQGYHFEPQTVLLDSRPQEIAFSLPASPEEIHRIGIQFPDVRDTVLVSSFTLPRLPASERVRLAWQQVNADEPIAGHSINFIRGPRILGQGFNCYLVSGVVGLVGIYGTIRVIRRRRVWLRVIAGIALVAWVLADGQATNNLARQAGKELDELRGQSRPEQIKYMNGPEIAWVYSQLSQHTPPGSSFAVISDDSFTPSRRLAYLLAPWRIWRESYEQADFLVVLRAGEAVFEEQHGMFRWKEGAGLRAEKIAELSSDVYILRRVGR